MRGPAEAFASRYARRRASRLLFASRSTGNYGLEVNRRLDGVRGAAVVRLWERYTGRGRLQAGYFLCQRSDTMILTCDVIRREIEAGRVVIERLFADQVGPASID